MKKKKSSKKQHLPKEKQSKVIPVNSKKVIRKEGRKLFDGKSEEIVIQKLEYVWSIGGSDKEASFYADISPAALSDYLKKHPLVSERKQALLNKPILKAREEVVKGLDGNSEFALKYLERKKSDEFSLKQPNIQNINIAKAEADDGNKYDELAENELRREFERRRLSFSVSNNQKK